MICVYIFQDGSENHTSSFGVPVPLSLTPESVAPAIVPETTLVQVASVFTVMLTALAQSSLAGGGGGVVKVNPTQSL